MKVKTKNERKKERKKEYILNFFFKLKKLCNNSFFAPVILYDSADRYLGD